MKKEQPTNLSFLDVLFGALGAVLILFIIMLSMSGAPPRERTPVNRVILWEVTFDEVFLSESAPTLYAQILVCNSSPSAADSDGKFSFDLSSISGKELDCSNPEDIPRQIDIGNLSIRKRYNETDKQYIISIELELTLEDESWLESLVLKMNSNQWKTVSVSISPGTPPDSEQKITEKSNSDNTPVYFMYKSRLIPQDDGLMPKIEEFRTLSPEEVK